MFKERKLSSFQIILAGFAAVILAGSLLLMLPAATKAGKGATFFDALFTATSAVCVTGLIVKDTATYWSVFGQSVIMALIQIGGLGIITIAIWITTFTSRKIGLMQRQTMQEAVSAHQVAGVLRLNRFIFKAVGLIEGIGVLLLFPGFRREFGNVQGLWYALFHSVSAFCNAGFDLMGKQEPFSSLTRYRADGWINLPIMFLIIVGGLGFLTWEDIRNNRWHVRRYRMQTKMILCATAFLIIVPALYFFFFEFQDYALGERFWMSLFQSVTARTAGFNTADLSKLQDTGKTLMIVLMLIGGAPGSTAGGMKTTTAVVLLLCAISDFKRQDQPSIFKRRIAQECIGDAVSILLMYVFLSLCGACVISTIEGLPMLTALFETASAIGTVGLTLGVTTTLGTISKLILISLMFFGRVGCLTMVYATVSNHNIVRKSDHYPLEKVAVG